MSGNSSPLETLRSFLDPTFAEKLRTVLTNYKRDRRLVKRLGKSQSNEVKSLTESKTPQQRMSRSRYRSNGVPRPCSPCEEENIANLARYVNSKRTTMNPIRSERQKKVGSLGSPLNIAARIPVKRRSFSTGQIGQSSGRHAKPAGKLSSENWTTSSASRQNPIKPRPKPRSLSSKVIQNRSLGFDSQVNVSPGKGSQAKGLKVKGPHVNGLQPNGSQGDRSLVSSGQKHKTFQLTLPKSRDSIQRSAQNRSPSPDKRKDDKRTSIRSSTDCQIKGTTTPVLEEKTALSELETKLFYIVCRLMGIQDKRKNLKKKIRAHFPAKKPTTRISIKGKPTNKKKTETQSKNNSWDSQASDKSEQNNTLVPVNIEFDQWDRHTDMSKPKYVNKDPITSRKQNSDVKDSKNLPSQSSPVGTSVKSRNANVSQREFQLTDASTQHPEWWYQLLPFQNKMSRQQQKTSSGPKNNLPRSNTTHRYKHNPSNIRYPADISPQPTISRMSSTEYESLTSSESSSSIGEDNPAKQKPVRQLIVTQSVSDDPTPTSFLKILKEVDIMWPIFKSVVGTVFLLFAVYSIFLSILLAANKKAK